MNTLFDLQLEKLKETRTGSIKLSQAIFYTATRYEDEINGHISLNPINDIAGETTFEKAHRSLIIIKEGIEKFRDLIESNQIPVPDTFSLETIRRSVARLFINQNNSLTNRVTFKLYSENEEGKRSMQAISATDPDVIEDMRKEFELYNPKESLSYLVDTEDLEAMNATEKKEAILDYINSIVIPNIDKTLKRLTQSQVVK